MRHSSPIAALLIVLSSGCGDLCGARTMPTCDIRETSCHELVQREVLCMRGAASSELPDISVITPAELEDHLRSGADPSMMRALEWEGALKLLGVLDPSVDLFEASIASSLANVAAFYSPSDRAVYVIDRGTLADPIEAVVTLAHELVHAAQDEEHDLGARLMSVETHEELMLVRSVAEGEATFYTFEAALWARGITPGAADWPSLYASLLDDVEARLDATTSPYFVVYGELPYAIGGRWATERWQRGRDTLVREGLAMPAASSAHVMVDPWSANEPPPPRTTTPCAPPPAPEGFSAASPDEMGAPLVYAFLRRSGMTHAEAWGLALEWRGDQLTVYGDPEGRVALAWRIVFERESAPRWVAMAAGAIDRFRTGHAADTVVLLTADDPTVTAGWSWSAEVASCAPPP